ncbi:uncharacterized protein N7477_001632 [Penicillium maclennaniae]|uniref:uncharacterized protein n=1 Tax=Penicillium maclennaniae TaxID=1343394 RepID=UPI002541FA47|nr:uncharacterized protein N7477_001632 [Penicillium maclennaniae]KAJ5681692.1 hypothetical protein N7477_001632 [Penicillium maclennaniae]
MSSQNSFVNASVSSNTVSTSAASAVRSRPRRLVSFMDDESDNPAFKNNNLSYNDAQPLASGTKLSTESGTLRSRGATPSPLSSRGTSPLPMTHPSRVTESSYRGRHNETGSLGSNGSSKASSSRGAADFLDSSWSSLQNLASSVLGSDAGQNTPTNANKTNTRRKPSRSDVYIRSIPRSTPSAWGPSGPSTPDIGNATKEERQALVQAKKREALLLADSDPITSRNFRHKKRDSGDYFDQPLNPEHDEEALAYIHHVQATDSITGVTIKYGCQAAVFRKANGFWPNDNIQSRKTVLLPVEACTVKGRRITEEQPDLLGDDNEDPNDSSITPHADSTNDSIPDHTNPSSCGSQVNRIWKHESWVQIDGFPSRVEIGRVPRRALGFFSSHSSEIRESISSWVAVNRFIPKRPPRIRTRGDETKPRPAHPMRPQHRRQRSSINLSGTGVGTLDSDSTAPGPAMDGLTQWLSKHVTSLAPPGPLQNNRKYSYGSESTGTPNASGLENIGGALEGWVRKVATRAKAGINDLQQGNPTQQAGNRGRNIGLWGMGDLIEMDDASEDRRSPSVFGTSRRPDQQSASSSSAFQTGASASSTSRSRVNGLGMGSELGSTDRLKDD